MIDTVYTTRAGSDLPHANLLSTSLATTRAISREALSAAAVSMVSFYLRYFFFHNKKHF